jgi:hypothetical protein
VDNISGYSKLASGAAVPVGSGYPWNSNSDSTGNMKYSTVSGEQRGVSTALYKATSTYKGHLGGLATGDTSQGQLYISWWWKSDTLLTGGDHSSKFLRLSTSTYPEDAGRQTFSWTQIDGYVYDNGKYGPASGFWTDYYLTTNQWNFMEAWIDNANKTFALYQNAKLSKSASWSNAGSFNFNRIWKVGFDGGGNAPPDITQWMDDIYVDNSFARVMICSGSTWSSRSHCEMQIPTSWSSSSITVKINRGSFGATDTAYLYVIDSGNANSDGYKMAFSGGGGSSDYSPTVAVSSPTTTGVYTTSANSLTIAGTASDDKGVSSVMWANSVGGSGTATDTSGSGSWSSWSVSSIPLQSGTNIITVTATDTAGQATSTVLTVTSSTSAISWAATSQTGDASWKDSSVTRCVRLLVQGASVTQPASKVRLGFQGRTSGSYTISKVSVAQRDANAAVGNVVASTWTKVTFDGHDSSIWGTDVITVPSGTEKISDVIPLTFLQGQDYYVTFNITSPSVYLNPPSGYVELYFDSADNTQTVQWAGTGYLTTQDYHGLATIHYAAPPAPTLRIGN